jgi:hypothetical protein
MKSGYRWSSAVALAVSACAFMIGAGQAMAQSQNESYNLAGLRWGMSLQDAKGALTAAGFQVTGQSAGKKAEFAVDRLHAVNASYDRGTRLSARGQIEGNAVSVELAFGKTNKLNHVFLQTRYWAGTPKDAQVMIKMAEQIVSSFESKYGPANKRRDDGWTDSAAWPAAKDGSQLAVHIRGVNGFMFSPSYKTSIRVDFANPRLTGGQVVGLRMDMNSKGWLGPSVSSVSSGYKSGPPTPGETYTGSRSAFSSTIGEKLDR